MSLGKPVMKKKTYEELERERNALFAIVEGAQKREAEAERVITLLVAAGVVTEDKIEQAREIARWK